MTTRGELRAEKALQGLEFPASKSELIDYATERSATAKTLQALEALPERRFESQAGVVEAAPQEPDGGAPGGAHR